jgi:hypothetical protein
MGLLAVLFFQGKYLRLAEDERRQSMASIV